MSFDPANSYGRLPVGWRIERLKFFAEVRNSNVDKVISEGEVPVRLCNYTDVYYNDRITSDMDFMEGSASDAELARFCLKSGQVLLTKDSESWQDIGVPAFVAEDMPGVVCGYHLSILDPGPELDGGYLAWLCRSAALNDQFKLGSNGVTRFGLGQYPLKNALVAVPPIEVQQRIARFLDEKTASIDALIEKKLALLERLAEKRQALITRAVTKGMTQGVPMKASGVDWIGDIPEGWGIQPLRFLGSVILGLTYKPEDVSPSDQGVLVLRASNISNGQLVHADDVFVETDIKDEIICREGDIVICSRNGSRHLIGKCGVVTKKWEGSTFGAFMTVVRSDIYEWLEFVLSSSLFEFQSGRYMSTTINQLTTSTLKSFPVPLPPEEEQKGLVRDLRSQCDVLDRTVSSIAKSIASLREYRSTLITAAVTGQLPELNG